MKKRWIPAAALFAMAGIIATSYRGISGAAEVAEGGLFAAAADTPIVNTPLPPDSASDSHQDIFSEKVEVCHKGRLISISKASLPVHLGHGDRPGSCE